MGFFSSRRTGDTKWLEDDRSVVQVIRSRFYGKYKGKERELFPNAASSPQLSRSGIRSQNSDTPDSSQHRRGLSRSPLRPLEQATPPSPLRTRTDAITSTLAQRLNELAVANSEGLLNDDEYRLLRQNIFERLASGSPVPTETPVITLNSHSHSPHKPSQLSPDSYVSAQFQAKPGRSPSVRSRSSVSSAMSNLFKRGSLRRVSAISKDSTISETSSIFSVGSMASNTFKRAGIPRELTSDSYSRRPETPLGVNARLSSSRQSGLESRSLGSSSYLFASRSTRRLGTAAPPSSFPGRNPEFKHAPSILTSPSRDDGLKSSQDIRREIELMEAEGRRLLDAFNGLELSALTRSQHKPSHAPSPRSPSTSVLTRRNGEYNDSFLVASGSTSGRGTPFHGSDADGMSLRSGVSYGTNSSQHPSHRPNIPLKANGPLSSLSAARKRSISSLSSRARVPPSTSSPALSQSRLRDLGSVSSINLAKPLSTRSAVSMEEDAEISVLESELNEIRRRRQEVTARYRDRLEYLRAQLKGAELREKLLRK